MYPGLGLTVSATTRAPRAGEVDGVDYHFMSDERFSHLVDAGEFLEWAEVHGHRYGTPMVEVRRNLDADRSLILEIDVQGALHVREKFPDAVLVFIKPPSFEALRDRLVKRGTETPESLELRLADARHEMELADRYDAVVVNDDLGQATDELLRTLKAYENE